MIGAGSVFVRAVKQLAALTVRHAVPAIYQSREFPAAGGATDRTFWTATALPAFIPAGSSRAKIPLNCQSCRRPSFELVINLKTAKTLGLTIPNTLIGRADEVIE